MSTAMLQFFSTVWTNEIIIVKYSSVFATNFMPPGTTAWPTLDPVATQSFVFVTVFTNTATPTGNCALFLQFVFPWLCRPFFPLSFLHVCFFGLSWCFLSGVSFSFLQRARVFSPQALHWIVRCFFLMYYCNLAPNVWKSVCDILAFQHLYSYTR